MGFNIKTLCDLWYESEKNDIGTEDGSTETNENTEISNCEKIS